MTVARNQRTYPLALKSDPLNVGIAAAYDWAAEDGSTATSNGKDHAGGNHHYTVPATPATIVTTSGGKGRDPSVGGTLSTNYYSAADAGAIGLGSVGTGDFSIWKRIRMPSAAASGTVVHLIGRFGAILQFQVYEIVANGGYYWYITGASTYLNWSDAGNSAKAAGVISDLHITRVSGTLKIFVNGVLIKTITGNTMALAADSQSCIMGCYSGTSADVVELDDIYWTRGLSDAEVAAHAANPYAYYDNTAVADSIAVSTPTSGSTVSPAIGISGTYAGGTAPTSIEASFNGGAYATIAASPAGGAFSGTLTGQTPGAGTLTVRTKNGAAVVATTTVASLTVVSDSITFTVPNTPATGAVPNRIFQRNGTNQASVRITGTYTGTPTAIEYQWNGGAWSTLVASPTGGTFDATKTLTGPGQGTLAVRFANSTGITTSMTNVGVGDVFLLMGQSNNVGFAPNYVVPSAPAGHAGWVVMVYDKAGRWRADGETSAQPMDSIVAGDATTYPVNATTAGRGSYVGALATRLMAAGVPCAFVPCALESTGISAWAASTSTSTLYGAALARATAVGSHKAVLWYQGEANVSDGTTRAAHETALNAIVNDWCGTRFPGAKFVLLNICETSGTPGGGSSTTSTGYDAIHAAIANVGATNTNVAAVGDMAGKYAQLHYETVGEINAVALVAYNALNSAFGYSVILATTASATLYTDAATPAASLTGLKWAFFDQATPDAFVAPVAKGASGSTNGAGLISVSIAGVTSLATGGTGWLVVTNSDGTVAGRSAAKVFDGPVAAA